MIRKQKRTMRVALLILFACFIFAGAAQGEREKESVGVQAKAYDPGVLKVCHKLFAALKSGDTVTLKDLLDGEMLQNNRMLLEQNEGYPEFLRQYYRGASFQIEEIQSDGDDVLVGFTINFPDGRKETRNLQMILRESSHSSGYGEAVAPKDQRTRYGFAKQIKEIQIE